MECTLTDLRQRGREIVSSLPYTGPITVTSHGKPIAQLVAHEATDHLCPECHCIKGHKMDCSRSRMPARPEPDEPIGQPVPGQLSIDDIETAGVVYVKDDSDATDRMRAQIARQWMRGLEI
ncbi:type II toxin-antitoxin system prevent-host-death family antitoxin [Actinomadura atramentaria]|uniref:type II toxin-antitoxin system prevent-host-death family antitoxin n=1 Tax=Actinomadura atramentaria TaxID=1990 RepID=UPI000382A042|nr:type II toxin-antitoxin system prevent-host-death family antitoxin [Actinomadura atramentaria]